MPAETQLLAWSIAVLAMMAFNTFSQDPDAKGLAILMALVWAMSNVLAALYEPPESMRLYPVMDVVAGVAAYAAWMRRRAVWKIVLAWLFFAQCLVHVAFWLHEARAEFVREATDAGNLVTYVMALNVLTALQLGCTGSSGVGSVGVRVLDRLRRRPRLGAAAPGG